MRTKEEFENERYFGIQKFDTFEEAVAVMKGKWGKEGFETQSKLLIADDNIFKDAVLLRAIERVCEARLGNLDWEKCKMDLGLSKKRTLITYWTLISYSTLKKRTVISHVV